MINAVRKEFLIGFQINKANYISFSSHILGCHMSLGSSVGIATVCCLVEWDSVPDRGKICPKRRDMETDIASTPMGTGGDF
jgi:hypothetical protein